MGFPATTGWDGNGLRQRMDKSSNQEYPVVQRLADGWQFAELLEREKRFITHLRLDDGRAVRAHCVNTGTMRGCLTPPQPAVISPAGRPGRKLPWTLEMIRHQGVWVDVNTQRANGLFAALVTGGHLSPFRDAREIRREVTFDDSRFDFVITDSQGRDHVVEVKQVTMAVNGEAHFPDAQSVRGRKHLSGLTRCLTQGLQAWAVYLIKREDCLAFGPAGRIDAEYAREFHAAEDAGVNVLPLSFAIEPGMIRYRGILPRCGGS